MRSYHAQWRWVILPSHLASKSSKLKTLCRKCGKLWMSSNHGIRPQKQVGGAFWIKVLPFAVLGKVSEVLNPKEPKKILSSSDPHPEALFWHDFFEYPDILFSSARWDLALAVEVRQCRRRRRKEGKEKAVLINLESRGPHLAGEEKSWNAMNAGHKRYKFMVMTIRLGRERIVTGTNWEPERTWNGRLAIGRCRQLASQIVA